MKKTRFLALALVVAIALMGAGYAWWTDTLVVNAEVDTGYLDVDFIKVETPRTFPLIGYYDPQDVTITHTGPKALGGAGENGEDRDLIEFEISKFYPGAKVRRYITLENVGTLEAKFNKNDIKFTPVDVNDELKPYLTAKASRASIIYPYSQEGGATLDTNIEPEFVELGLFDYINLKVGQTCILEVEFELNKLAPNDTEVRKASYAMTLNIKQFNE